ncbi:MAG: hypothetical protein V4677_08715 [Bacteroidota bacterium]
MASEKQVNSIKRIFNKLEAESFDENDIKILLIDIREFLKEETFLREIADFIAHPERNKGLCHQAVDSRYARMKMFRIGGQKLMNEKVFENNLDKPERFFSDQVLSYIDTRKISKDDYLLFVQSCLQDIEEDLFIEHYKLTKKQIQTILNKCYVKQNGYYILNPTGEKHFKFIEDILRFIRGTITTRGIITQTNVTRDLKLAIKKANKLPGISVNVNLIDEVIESIIVCILALLHGSNFIMYDGMESKSFISIHGENLDTNTRPPVFEYFTLALIVNANEFIFPIATTKISHTKYIDGMDDPEKWNLATMPWIYTQRINGKLKLVEEV